jgi:hypothetical protein
MIKTHTVHGVGFDHLQARIEAGFYMELLYSGL